MGMYKVPVDNFVIYYTVHDDSRTVTVIRIFYGGRDVANIVNAENEWHEKGTALINRIDVLRKEAIANVSHELCAPLFLITDYSEWSEKNPATQNRVVGFHILFFKL